MQLESSSFEDDGWIPEEFVFGVADSETHVRFGPNRNPHLAWSELPQGTRSVVVTCVDVDVPTVPDDVNQEGREVSADLPRAEFVHWLLIDVAPEPGEIEAGEYSEEVTPRGKDGRGPQGRQGVNDYTGWFAGDTDMEGTYLGYDGPCPPWNDARVHRYRFGVQALDVASLDVPERFTLEDVRQAAAGHVLAEVAITGRYTLNARLSS